MKKNGVVKKCNMKIKKEQSGRFLYMFDYDFSLQNLEFCRYIKSTVGWEKFNFFESKWRFNDLVVVEMLKNKYPELEIDEETKVDLQKYELQKQADELLVSEGNKIKEKTDTDLVINNVTGELYPYQRIGVEFLINNKGRAIINSDMGTGKSLQSLAYVVHENINKTLIITQASIKWSFESEVKKWTKLKPFVISSKTKFTIDTFNENDVFIINYDLLKKFIVQLTNFNFGCLIIDECQKIKSINAIRSKLTKQIAKGISKVILLTGTLMLSRPSELFNSLNILEPNVWNNWYSFTKKYCNGHNNPWGYDFSGASNIDELKKVISKYYIRHTKEEVLKDLPEKVFIDVPMELDSESKFKYDLTFDSFVEYLKDVKKKNDTEIKKSLQAEKLTRLSEIRQIATNAKINTIKELTNNIIENDEKVIIFSSYNEPLKKIQEHFGSKAVLLIGETPELFRKKIIDAFQTNPEIKIFLCGYASGGVGITLTAANNVIFCDFPWNPADLSQAYSRAHRIGNKAEHINIYQIIAKNTIDIEIKEMLNEKQKLFDQIFNDGKAGNAKSLVTDLLKKYENS